MKVGEIASEVNGSVSGNTNLEINRANGLDTADVGDISFLANSRFLDLAKKSNVSCIITKESFGLKGKTLIYTDNPALSFIKVIELLNPKKKHVPGVSHLAVIGEKCEIDISVHIAAYVVIGSGVRIGKNVTIEPFSYIHNNASIGDETIIKPGVTILEDSIIGKRVIIHSGTVIGSDGYAYVTDKEKHYKVPQIGRVVIEDDCEIGANVTIDRASFGKTLIKRGTKIDNLVQIAHNVTVDENTLIVAQVGIAGSCKIGKNVILAGQVGVADHLEIGDGAIVGAQGGVTKNVPPNAIFSGYPARDHSLARRIYAASRRLPELLKRVSKLEKRLKNIEERQNPEEKKL